MENVECSAPLWSFNFISKLMRAANFERFCPNPFCREVHEGCLPDNKNDSDNTYTICSLYEPRHEISNNVAF